MDINYKMLWKMSDSGQSDALIVRADKTMSKEEIGKLVKGEFRPDEPIQYRFHMGRIPKDLISTAWPGRVILSSRVIAALQAGKFTGWSVYPVRIMGKNSDEILGYHGLAITGRCGPPDNSRRQKVNESPSGQFVRVRGLFFDEQTWDGSDIFRPEGTRHICVTEAVHNAIMALKPKNITFTRLDEATGILIDRIVQRK